MLDVLPFLAWLAALTSAVLLILLRKFGDIGLRAFVVLLAWLLIAAYCQFLGSSAPVRSAGLVLQTMLAVVLLLRWRLRS